MYKKILFAASIILFALPVQAGNENGGLTTAKAVVGDMFPHFNPNAASQGSPIGSRLIAKVNFSYDHGSFIPSDSVRYMYFAYRGGTPDLDDPNDDTHILFDESISYKYSQVDSKYEYEQRRTQEFDAKNRIKNLTYQDWHALNQYWKNKERYVYQFDNAGKMTATELYLWYANSWSNKVLSSLSYDGNNNVTKMSSVNYKVDFVYQGNNLVTMEDRVYDLGKGWQPSQKRTYTYTGSDVSTFVLELYDDNTQTWNKTQKWEYVYDANKRLTSTIEYFWDGSWRPKYQTHQTYHVNGNISVKTIKQWNAGANAFENYKREEWTYNSYDQPVEIKEFSWNNVAYAHVAGDKLTRYYYEDYDPNSVSNIVANNSLQVYPLPANNVLHIQADVDATAPISISLMDMTGRMVYNNTVTATNRLQADIQVASLPQGNYILQMANSSTKTAKQITIAH